MKITLAPSLLLSVLCCSNDSVAAFNAAQQLSVTSSYRPSSAISMTNDFDPHYNVDVDRRGNIQNIAESGLNRRDALARFAASVAASAAFLGGRPAFAADAAAAAEFSESPTSEASIARTGYDGKGAPAPAVEAESAAAPAEEVTKEVAEPKKKEDFDGNEAGSVGNGVGASWKKKVKIDPKLSIPDLNLPFGELVGDDGPKLVGGAVALVALTAIANGGGEEEPANPLARAKSAPPAEPYGLSGGRNYWDGVDMTAAKQAGLVAPAPPAPVVVAKPEPAKVEAANTAPKGDKPKWKLDAPTPYGIQNKDGNNPFIKEVMEYCEGGKVTEPCTETIKGYLDTIAESGAVATTGEVQAIAGYLDALGSDGASSAIGGAGAAFASYLDALSAGSAPPPSSAKAVKTYLDTLNGTGAGSSDISAAAAPEQPVAPAAAVVAPVEPTPEPAAVESPTPAYFNLYDSRLTNIEDRVTSLESKVDQIPDQVFEKIEAWQTQQEGRLTEEVKKIVNALAPPPAPPAEPVAVLEAPAPVAPPVPEPVVFIPEPEPVVAAPIVQATPFAAAIPQRSSMPMPDASYAKKGFGFGGEAGWKTGNPSSSSGGGYLDNMSP